MKSARPMMMTTMTVPSAIRVAMRVCARVYRFNVRTMEWTKKKLSSVAMLGGVTNVEAAQRYWCRFDRCEEI